MAEEATTRSDCIRSVERAIDVLQALNRRPISTLGDLHCETGLPKPSIVRLLRTLEAKGLAARSSSYGTYQLLGRVKSLASGFHHEPRIVEVAEDPMIGFTRREGWPLSLALFDLDAVVVRACTIRFTSLSLEHSSLNRRLSMVTRALGRAYLAFSTANEQAILRAILRDSQDPEDAGAHDEEAMDRMIAQVRERGYATRNPLVDPRSATIAVPIAENGRTIASLGMTWIAAAMSREEAVNRYLQPLLDTADRISDALAADWTTGSATPSRNTLAAYRARPSLDTATATVENRPPFQQENINGDAQPDDSPARGDGARRLRGPAALTA